MPANEAAANWIATKLKDDDASLEVMPLGDGYLKVNRHGGVDFVAAAIGVDDLVRPEHVMPLFQQNQHQPEFVVNVPSKTIWTGEAIEIVHDAPAAFGTMGDLIRASRSRPVHAYRNKQYDFFERAFRQHSKVTRVLRLYDRMYRLERIENLPALTVVLVDTYDMSAEDIRHARDLYGRYDAALKMTSYGSITTAAHGAASAIGAEAFKFGDFLGRLHKR